MRLRENAVITTYGRSAIAGVWGLDFLAEGLQALRRGERPLRIVSGESEDDSFQRHQGQAVHRHVPDLGAGNLDHTVGALGELARHIVGHNNDLSAMTPDFALYQHGLAMNTAVG